MTKKSDQAEFTGIDDGNTQKTINLKIKENKKNGFFGKADVSGGLSDRINNRFNNNLLFSTFKGKRKLSAFLLNGNTGQDGLSWEDSEKYGSGDNNFTMTDDGAMYMYQSSSEEEPYVNTNNGFITNINAGIQYSNKWNDKTNLNLSPKYNSQDYFNTMDYFRQTTVGDSLLFENASTATKVFMNNFKTSGVLDIKIDSNNSLKLTVKGNFYRTESEENRNSVSTGDFGTLKNTSNRLINSVSEKQAFGSTLLFKHKFRKDRRTLSVSANWNLLKTDGNNYLKSQNQGYVDGMPSFMIDLNQFKDNLSSTTSFSSKAIYTEPISKNYSFEIGHEVSINSGTNDQITYTYSPVSGKYDTVLDSLTNDFSQSVITNKPSLKISYSTKKLKYNFGSGFGFTHFKLSDNTISKDYIRDFTNFYPSASLTYSYKTSASYRFNYNGYTTQPTINQLQPLRNNDDYYNQYIGNPNLKTSFTNSLNISHHSYDFLKDKWMYQSLNIRLVNNSITNNRTINLDSGKTIIQPINTDGNLSVQFWAGTGFKLKKSKIRIDINPNGGYTRFAEYINNVKNYTNNLRAGLSASLSKSEDKKYDITLSDNYSYNSNKLSQQPKALHYQTNNLSLDATVYYKKVWSISTDYNFYSREKTPQFNTDLNSHIWNAKLQRTFHKDEFTAYFKVRDILKQDIGVDRTFYGNTLTETRNDRLQRYWLVGFAWNFKNK
ncbi:MAG: outer membrane beta-barrel protein [Ferruginibacter sp.]